MRPNLSFRDARRDERGVALVSALLVLALMGALLVGFVALVSSDQNMGAANRDQSKAYAAAHAGVEKLTSDLGQVFARNFSPTASQVNALWAEGRKPKLDGATYSTVGGDPGYEITFPKDNQGNPAVENPDGSPITSGNFQGLRGLITPYEIKVTAQTAGGAEVSMRRELQTVAIPVFQFGIFSENDLSFFAGANFSFGGRVHTNQNLFLKQDGGTLTLQDRVSAVGEVVRNSLANQKTDSHTGPVRMARASGCPAAPDAITDKCRELALTEGSITGYLGSAINKDFDTLSTGAYNGYIRNGRTGAKRLDLPLVSDGAEPIDLIRRAPVGEAVDSSIYGQRFFGMATLRILLSDTVTDIEGLPSVKSKALPLSGTFTVDTSVPGALADNQVFAVSTGVAGDGYRMNDGITSIGGYIGIDMQQRDGTWVDVTKEILSLGFSGRNISTGTVNAPGFDSPCAEIHSNAVIRIQRVRDNPTDVANHCGLKSSKPTVEPKNYWPNVLYDPREGARRDDTTSANPTDRMYWSGVMHYVELDVNNLKKWIEKTTGTKGCASSSSSTSCPMDVTGYVVYFSDRRSNRNTGGLETGEFGWEDNINPASATSTPNGVKDGAFKTVDNKDAWSEDVNGNGTLETYGNTPRFTAANVLSGYGSTVANYNLTSTMATAGEARVNPAFFFRRALKVVNARLGMLPHNEEQGLTIASENPVYLQGNFNACSSVEPTKANSFKPACTTSDGFDTTPGASGSHVSAAVVADAVTFLSNSWNDIRSFVQPHRVGGAQGTGDISYIVESNQRQAQTTWYRLGLISGKGLNFKRPTSNDAQDHPDFGTDGGAHNFIRYLENWKGASLNYRGSLISFYTSRQGVGIYKCCDVVYGAPSRGYKYDVEFLIPSQLPPRTPMFRDLNTLGFRQILRPTEKGSTP